jgi:hypothetical protein
MEMQKVRMGTDGKISGFDAPAFEANPVNYLTGYKMNHNAEDLFFCKRLVISGPCTGVSRIMNDRVDKSFMIPVKHVIVRFTESNHSR